MNQQDFEVVFDSTISEISRLLVVKGGEYAGSEDRLANFKRCAALTGCTPLQAWHIYAAKHWDAVATFVRDSANGVQRERSEPIEGRFDDLINYMILGKAIVKEMQEDAKKAEEKGRLRDLEAAAFVSPVGAVVSKWISAEAGRLPILERYKAKFEHLIMELTPREFTRLFEMQADSDKRTYLFGLGAPV